MAGIILSAGASHRMGRAKALLKLKGRTFIENLVRDFQAGRLSPIIVVLGHEHIELSPHIPEDACIAINPQYQKGQFSSLRVGLRALAKEGGCSATPVLLTLVDQPFAPLPVITALQKAINRGASAAVPTLEGCSGHPVLLGPELVQKVLTAEPTTTLASLLAGEAVPVEVEDKRILLNINTPRDYQLIENGGYP